MAEINLGNIDQQEVFLLERYASLDYFGALRDAWKDMLGFVESRLE